MSDMTISEYDNGLVEYSAIRSENAYNKEARETDELARRINSLEIPSFPIAESKSLEGRITQGKVPTTLEQLQAVMLNQPNYLNEIRICVAKMLAQISRSGEKDRNQIEEMKKRYEKAYHSSAGLTKTIAWNGLIISGLALIPLLMYTLPGANQFDKDMAKSFAEQIIPRGGEMWNSFHHADMKKADSLAGLLLQEYSAKTQKGSSESGTKQEITTMLEKAISALKEAARAG